MIPTGVPEPFHAPRSKPEITLREIDRVTAQGVRFGLMLVDVGSLLLLSLVGPIIGGAFDGTILSLSLRHFLLGAASILFVLYTAIPWERLPFEVAGCSGMTCWRRLRAWQDSGLWDEIHSHMLERLNLAGAIDWSRASVDASSVPAKGGATRSGRTRPIAASRAQSGTSWSTEGACLSPSS